MKDQIHQRTLLLAIKISYRESYLVEPIENHPTATEHAQTTASHHNRVIYKASDVEYDKHFSRCNSDTSLRLRAVQVSLDHYGKLASVIMMIITVNSK